jgi:hypothetical protein
MGKRQAVKRSENNKLRSLDCSYKRHPAPDT